MREHIRERTQIQYITVSEGGAEMVDLSTNVGNLRLENPIIISSGHVTLTPRDVLRADSFGAGAVVMKSSLLEKEYSQVVRPYAPGRFPDARMNFLPLEDGLLTICGLSPLPLEEWAEWIEENKKNLRTPLIGSYMAISIEGYVDGAKMLQDAGVDAIELCLACPLPYLYPHRYAGRKLLFDDERVEEICRAVREVVTIPLGAKAAQVSVVKRAGLDFVTLAAGFPGAPGIDLDTIEPKMFSSVFQTGAPSAKYSNFTNLLNNAQHVNSFHISANGGCRSWEDIIEYIFYGASSVQIQTAFIRKGLGIIEELKADIQNYMIKKGFKTLEEMRGIILPKLITYDEYISTYGATKGRIIAQLDEQRCNNCGVCIDTCIYDALAMADGRLRIMEDRCEGCNVCVINCPEGAMSLRDVDLIRRLAKESP